MVVSHDFLENPRNCDEPDTLDLQGQLSLTALRCERSLLLWNQGQKSILFLLGSIRELSTKPVQNFCIIWDEVRRESSFSRNFVLWVFCSAEPKGRIWIRRCIVKSPLFPIDFPITVQPSWADGNIHLFFFFELWIQLSFVFCQSYLPVFGVVFLFIWFFACLFVFLKYLVIWSKGYWGTVVCYYPG